MVKIVKHEWHQTDRQYSIEVDEVLLNEIYPDMEEEEIASLLKQIGNSEIDIGELLDDAANANAMIDWEFQYEDCWTERKGGYDVTYDVSTEKQVNPLIETLDESSSEDAVIYPPGEYTIRIWGRTREIGVSKIKKAQFDYWSDEDHEDDLSDALNENYDYEENETPKAARFELPYYEYQDKISFWGFDEDSTHVTITNKDEEIFEGDMGEFEGEELEELYPDYLGKGYWLMWTQGGKGSCLQVTINTGEEEFDLKKLSYTSWDVEGSTVINRLHYDGVELDDEGMDSEHENWRGQWSTFNVHHNKK